MKVVNETQKNTANVNVTLTRAPKNRVLIYNRKTGESKALHSVDAREILKNRPELWSATPVAKEQAQAEDATIVESEKKPVASEAKPEVAEPVADEATEPKTWDEHKTKSRSKRNVLNLFVNIGRVFKCQYHPIY